MKHHIHITMSEFDLVKYRKVRFREFIRQINIIRESKNLNPVSETATLNECIQGL
nr:MAG TPA: hypothetical protein [Caudoviricetes sp.]